MLEGAGLGNTRDDTYPSLVTQVEVGDGTTWTTTKTMLYWLPGVTGYEPAKQGLLYQETVPDIEGNDGKVTTYDYEETIGFDLSPTAHNCQIRLVEPQRLARRV